MKAKIFVGDQSTGKSKTAEKISDFVGKNKTVILDGRDKSFEFNSKKNTFMYLMSNHIKENTELIIVDDCPDDFFYESMFSVDDQRPYGGELMFSITVQKRGEEIKTFKIPKLIFIAENFEENENHSCASFTERVDVIKFPTDEQKVLEMFKN